VDALPSLRIAVTCGQRVQVTDKLVLVLYFRQIDGECYDFGQKILVLMCVTDLGGQIQIISPGQGRDFLCL
jgi:hypothetical protein